MKIGDHTKPLYQQAKDLGYESLEDALKDGRITAVPYGIYKDYRLEIPEITDEHSMATDRPFNTVMSLDNYYRDTSFFDEPIGGSNGKSK